MPIEKTEVTDTTEKLPIEAVIHADSTGKLSIEESNTADLNQTATNKGKNMPIKLSFKDYEAAYQGKGYNRPSIAYLQEIYREVDANQIFGSSYLVKTLGCTERTARNLMAKLREMNVVEAVMGKGKGMYRFKLLEDD